MNNPNYEARLSRVRSSLLTLCHESGVLTADNPEKYFDENLIEGGLVDSLGVACLQEQIETRYSVEISLDQFVAELHTLEKIALYLAAHSPEQVYA